MFEPDNDHLELLLEFGLGTGDGGPWRARLGPALDAPEQLVRGQLDWAITHGMTDRVRLLPEHGTDPASPFADGVTPAARAPPPGIPVSPASWAPAALPRPTSIRSSVSSPPPWPRTRPRSTSCGPPAPAWPRPSGRPGRR